MLDGTVEIDHFHLGGRQKKHSDDPPPGRGRKGQANTEKAPVLAMVQRPNDITPGMSAGDARATVVADLSSRASERVIETQIKLGAHLMSDEWKAFMSPWRELRRARDREAFQRRICSRRRPRQFGRRFQFSLRRTIAGVFHHISPQHTDLYFHEIGFRWSQRVVTGNAVRKTRRGRETIRTLWSRVPPALQLMSVFRAATGRQMRRIFDGGIIIKSAVAVLVDKSRV